MDDGLYLGHLVHERNHKVHRPRMVSGFDADGDLWTIEYTTSLLGRDNMCEGTPIRVLQRKGENQEMFLHELSYEGLKLTPDRDDCTRRIVRDLAVSPNGRLLVVACQLWKANKSRSGSRSSGESTLELWDLERGGHVATWNKNDIDKSLYCVAFDPTGKRVATGGQGGVSIWDIESGNKLRSIHRHSAPNQVLFSPDGKLVFSNGGQSREDILVGDVETGDSVGVWKGHENEVGALAISPDGQILASGGKDFESRLKDFTVRLWEVPSGRELACWEAHNDNSVLALAFSPDGKRLASSGADRTLRFWNIPYIRSELSRIGLQW